MHFLFSLLTSYSDTVIAKQLIRLLTVDHVSDNDYLKRQAASTSVILGLLHVCVVTAKQEHEAIN